MTNLRDIILEMESGSRPKGGIQKADFEIPSLGAEHLSDTGGFNLNKIKYVSADFYNKLKSGKVKKDDILIVKDGATTGKVSYVNTTLPFDKSAINEHVFRIYIDQKKSFPKFIFWYLKSSRGQREILSDFRGATVGGITKGFIERVNIPKYSLSEEKFFAEILDKSDSIRQMRKESIALLDKFLKSVFLEMVGDPVRNENGWEGVKAKEIFEIQLGKMLSAKNYTGKSLRPYLRNLNVQWGRIDATDVNRMDFNEKEFEKYKLVKGDILVTEGGDVGRTAIFNDEVENCCYQNALHRLRKLRAIDSNYFLYFMWFASKYGMLLKDTSTVTIAHFTAEKFKEFKILLPPLILQTQFSKIVDQVEGTKAKMEDSLKEMDNQFNALMGRAFGG